MSDKEERKSKLRQGKPQNQTNQTNSDVIVIKPQLSNSDQNSSYRPDVQTEKLSEVAGNSGKASRMSNQELMVADGLPEASISTFGPPKKHINAANKNDPRRSQLPINFVDYENTKLESIQSVDESSTCRRHSVHNLTVRDGKVQITSDSSEQPDANLRTAINTGGHVVTSPMSPTSKPNLRYVVKEEATPSPTAGSRNSNEDLLSFSRGLVIQTAQPTHEKDELSIMPALHQRHGPQNRGRPSQDRSVGNHQSTSKMKKRNVNFNEARKLKLEEHLLSPFETDSGSRPS